MHSFFNSPFPSDYGNKEKVYIALLVGLFVAVFLFAFEPFGIADESENEVSIIKFIGFGVVAFLGMLFIDYVLPKLIPTFFEERHFTIGKELIVCLMVVLSIGIGNALYLEFFFFKDLGINGMLVMIWQTFLVGIFPLTILTLLKYNKLQKDNLRISQEINIGPIVSNSQGLVQNTHTPYYESGNTEVEQNQELNLAGLLYIESVGNYVNVTTADQSEVSRNLYRRTLKSIDDGQLQRHIVRCHRSYIVNLKRVTEVTGNAQGLKLHLEGCEEKVPVSRKYIPEVKEYFSAR